MRLYEFTEPTKYILPETDATDLVKRNDDSKAADTTNIAERHLREKPSTKRLSDRL
jgi:hypothetical protein